MTTTETDLPAKFSSIKNCPSITQQTSWPVEYFNFGKWNEEGVNYFNPGLVQRPDGLWLIARRSKQNPKYKIGFNDLVAFKLDNHIPAMGVKVKMRAMFPELEHFEDPRALYHNGQTYISCCNFVMRNQQWTGAHQIVQVVDRLWNSGQRYDPIYGMNGPELGRNKGSEKNWTWFFHDGNPHLIYYTIPHQVVMFSREFQLIKAYETTPQVHWEFGQPRGGTPPVLVGNEYWSFFHSSTTWKFPKRQYHMGAYAFEARPPFKITRMTLLPLLSGSRHDPYSEAKPLVVFPCGAVLENDKWFVTMGVNDLESAWIEIPHEDIVKRTQVLEKVDIVPKIGFVKQAAQLIKTAKNGGRVYYHSGNLGDIIYSLAAIRLKGSGDLLIGPKQNATAPCREPTTREQFEILLPLLKTLPYLRKVEFRPEYPAGELTHDLNEFRNHWNDWPLRQKTGIHSLCKMHCYQLGVLDKFKEIDPWIEIKSPILSGKIVIHRSRRYNATNFPWVEIVERFRAHLLFIGLEQEHVDFEKAFGRVSYYRVLDFLEMARLIAGANGAIMNQSFPCSLAISVGQRIFQESFEPSMDCVFERPSFKNQFSGDLSLIDLWPKT